MTVTFITHDPCGVCGYHRPGVMATSMRVNKRSMRSVGQSMTALPYRCLECGRATGMAVRLTWRLTEDSAEKVRATRLRRWPELAEVTA